MYLHHRAVADRTRFPPTTSTCSYTHTHTHTFCKEKKHGIGSRPPQQLLGLWFYNPDMESEFIKPTLGLTSNKKSFYSISHKGTVNGAVTVVNTKNTKELGKN